MFQDYYKHKKVLVTGHTGFKGGWLSVWLHLLGAKVVGLSLPAPTDPNLHQLIARNTFIEEVECDVRHLPPLKSAIARIKPDLLFHLAAQPIVRRSYAEPLETFETNTLGTANLLEAVRSAELGCPVIVITSDKCYENREWEYAYRENDPLGGHDVYSMSKAAAEMVAQSWNRSFFLPNPKLGPLVTVRAGNVIGGGDYAQDRIVPDCVRALMAGQAIPIRNPRAVRPWQHVFECLSGYLWLGARVGNEPKTSPLVGPFNFGPDPSARKPVKSLVDEILKTWPGTWEDRSNPNSPHEATLLTLAIEKANVLLDWRPVWNFGDTVRYTIEWYHQRHVARNTEMLAFSEKQVEMYVESARQLGLAWTQ